MNGIILTSNGYDHKVNVKTITLKKEEITSSDLNSYFFHSKFKQLTKVDDSDNSDNISILNLQLIPNIKENQ